MLYKTRNSRILTKSKDGVAVVVCSVIGVLGIWQITIAEEILAHGIGLP